jgi:uncharacterized delta-60 repeat protein
MGSEETMTGSRAGVKLSVGCAGAFVCLALWIAVLSSAGAASGGSASRSTEPPLPADATGVGLAFSDLASAGGGKLLAATNTYASRGYFAVARLTAAGVLDKSFGGGGYTKPVHLSRPNDVELRSWAVARQGSKIILAGYQENEFGGSAPVVARYSPAGRIDRGFGSNGLIAPLPATEGQDPSDPFYKLKGGGRFLDVAVRADGEIIAVGGIDEESGRRPAAMVAAYRPDGSVDKSFGENGRVVIAEPRGNLYTGLSKVRLLPGGRILAAGYLHGRLALVALRSDGRPDPGFGGGDGLVMPKVARASVCCSSVAALTTSKGGRILLGGVAGGPKQSPFVLLGLKSDGSADPSFGNGGVAAFSPGRRSTKAFDPYSMTVVPNGRILVAGIAERIGPESRISPVPAVLAYRANGRVDSGFGQAGAELLVGGEEAGLVVAATTTNSGSTYVSGGTYEPGKGRPKYRPLLTRVGS